MLGCSPVKLHGVAKRNITGHGKGKVAQASLVRLQYTTTVPGTRIHQEFVLINISELKIYLLPSDKEDTGTKVSITDLTSVAIYTCQLCQ
jgi:hypothetical protein